MNKERLENLIVALQDARPEDFHMDNYLNECGTPACVLGHYASRTDLQDLLVRDLDCDGHMSMLYKTAAHWAHYDDEKICDHFEIEEFEAIALFSSSGCDNASTPVEAIAFIREFIDMDGDNVDEDDFDEEDEDE